LEFVALAQAAKKRGEVGHELELLVADGAVVGSALEARCNCEFDRAQRANGASIDWTAAGCSAELGSSPYPN